MGGVIVRKSIKQKLFEICTSYRDFEIDECLNAIHSYMKSKLISLAIFDYKVNLNYETFQVTICWVTNDVDLEMESYVIRKG